MQNCSHSVALIVRHPSLDPSEIAAAIGLVPTFTQTAGMARTTPAGRRVSGTYTESYACFYIATPNGLDATLGSLGDFLVPKAAVLGKWIDDHGRVSIAISVGGTHAAATVPSQLLRLCGRLEVNIELSLHDAAQRHAHHVENALEGR